jgi:SAM-dependent methyltransferase
MSTTENAPSPKALHPKELQRRSWTAVAPGWKRHDAYFTRATAAASEKMLDAAGVGPGKRVLDVATGVGEPALAAARRVGAGGFVLGTDFVEPMLAYAREKAAAAGLRNVEFRCVDGEALDERAGSFDAVTIRWGIMFMPDALACLRSAHRALASGGRVAVACWAGPERNPWGALPAGILMRKAGIPSPPPGAPGVFAYADPKRLEGALVEAGFQHVVVEPVDLPMIDFDTFDEYWTWTRELVGPVASMLEKLTPDQTAAAVTELEAEVAKLSPGGRTVLGGTTWVASGQKTEARNAEPTDTPAGPRAARRQR